VIAARNGMRDVEVIFGPRRRIMALVGVPKAETEATCLLPARMTDAYTTGWDKPLLDLIDRQTALAVETGVLPHPPEKPFLVASPVDRI
jgi:hypothetical protein